MSNCDVHLGRGTALLGFAEQAIAIDLACFPQVPEGEGVKDWDVHHGRGAAPVGAPALQRFGGGIRAKGDALAATRLLSHVAPSDAPDEVRIQ